MRSTVGLRARRRTKCDSAFRSVTLRYAWTGGAPRSDSYDDDVALHERHPVVACESVIESIGCAHVAGRGETSLPVGAAARAVRA